MIGGGPGAFIGEVHRMAARLDGKIELVCGAFSSDPKKSIKFGKELFLNPSRVYDSYEQMINEEAKLGEGERMDFVSIVTPNHLHFEPSKLALNKGFHVVCDKPVTFTLAEAKQLKKISSRKKLIFAVTHNYTGYPMIKEAKSIVASNKLGRIRRAIVEYPQGWLSKRLEQTGQKQASWRTDPNKSGLAGCMGDIGTHAENLLEYLTGLKIKKLCADLNTFVKGRSLDDDGAVLLELENGAKAILMATQIAVGEENNLRIRVYGEKGSVDWSQENNNSLILRMEGRPKQILRTGTGELHKSTMLATRLPAGHPEGFIEAFANIYQNVALTIDSLNQNKKPKQTHLDFPTIDDGIRGMQFIQKVVASNLSKSKWTKF